MGTGYKRPAALPQGGTGSELQPDSAEATLSFALPLPLALHPGLLPSLAPEAQNFSWALLGKPTPRPDGWHLAAVSTAAPAECPALWGRGVQCEGPQTGEWRTWQGGRNALAGPSNTQEPLPGGQSGCRGVGGLDKGREVRRECGQVRELAQHGQASAGRAGQRSGRRGLGCRPVASGPPQEAGSRDWQEQWGSFPMAVLWGRTLLLMDSTLLGLFRMGPHPRGPQPKASHCLRLLCQVCPARRTRRLEGANSQT